jgi:hypothetical protein
MAGRAAHTRTGSRRDEAAYDETMRAAIALACSVSLFASLAHADEGCADIRPQSPAGDEGPPPIAAGKRLPATGLPPMDYGAQASAPTSDVAKLVGRGRMRVPWGTLVLVPLDGSDAKGVLFVRERAGVRCVLGSWYWSFGGNGVTVATLSVLGAAKAAKRRVVITASGHYRHYHENCTSKADGGDDDCQDGQRYVGGDEDQRAVTLDVDSRGVQLISTKEL